MLRGGPVAVDLNALSVTVDGRVLDLTPTEYRLLVTLIERRGRVQSRQQLLETAWDIHARIETRTVDMHVQRLRSKLGEHGHLIETARGFGYRFKARGEHP
jgi:two-component system, OmpR family, phosphate regulon response regulator PhoB